MNTPAGMLGRSPPHNVPPCLVYFAIPPFRAAFVIAAIDPMGEALRSCLTIKVVVQKVLPRFAGRMAMIKGR